MRVSLATYLTLSPSSREAVTHIDLALDKAEERGYVSLRERFISAETSDQYVEAETRQMTFEGFNR